MSSKASIQYRSITPADFANIITLGNHVHGEGYLNEENIKQWFELGFKNNIKCWFCCLSPPATGGF